MKKLLLLLALCLLLTACDKPTPSPSPTVTTAAPEVYAFTTGNYPTIAVPVGGIPLAQCLAARLLDMPREETAARYTVAGSTPEAYALLITGQCDLIFVTEPDDETLTLATSHSVTLQKIAIGRDALVFYTATANTVTALTLEQLNGIYTGGLTHWTQIGGDNAQLQAYATGRSASTTLLKKLVLNGVSPTAQTLDIVNGDSSTTVYAAYANETNAIGYTLFSSIALAQPHLLAERRLFTVNGFAPSRQTLTDNSYPLGTTYYAVIRGDEATDSPVRILAEWLATADGQALLDKEKYPTLKS